MISNAVARRRKSRSAGGGGRRERRSVAPKSRWMGKLTTKPEQKKKTKKTLCWAAFKHLSGSFSAAPALQTQPTPFWSLEVGGNPRQASAAPMMHHHHRCRHRLLLPDKSLRHGNQTAMNYSVLSNNSHIIS